MKKGTPVTHAELGTGTVIDTRKKWVNVLFDNGKEQMVFKNSLSKASKNHAASIASSLMNVSEGNKTLAGLPVWSEIMQVADEQGHFASDIVEKALSGKTITQKQAYAVAYFANENNIK